MFALVSMLTIIAMILGACQRAPAEDKLEIFSWWTTGGEAAGLNAMYEIYKKDHANTEIVNATVAGGAGSNAQAVLASRMQGGDPPDSFQVHMGHELIDTWVVADKMENLDDLYQSEGWVNLFPKGVLDIVSFEGHYYSVPANIHRANVMWYNTATFQQLGIAAAPKTFDEWFAMAETCKAAGLPALALGDSGPWTSVHLFETVLIGTLGAEGYKGLWTGATAWSDPMVTTALETMDRMLDYVNSDHAALSWDQANQLVIDGKACTTIMGDWVDADNLAKKFAASGWAPAPGNEGIYDALSDSFGLPKGAKHSDQAKDWLRLVGSKAGQEAFNPVKGSICARTDCDPNLFGPYLQSAMEDWKTDTVVPSLAHGAAAKSGWVQTITDAINRFVTERDVASTQSGLATACVDAGVCK
ncbi:MAG: carbohydrate ABC transporter substrate-binding protein [Chloroflexota bacterium]|nr:MAG: carbohydrate ABC transporter substrate-binding protein [Chloroflexota bacterium]